ncbi:MAG TPA: ABC transporter permease, partial [Bryobacteraceae bacterium]
MNWGNRLLHRTQLEEQLDKEVRFHLEQHAGDLVKRGVPEAEAWREARLAIGGPEQVKEGCRDARGTRWVEDLGQDIRYALRWLRHKPGFAAVTLATLALGIGATTLMFTVVDSVLLKPLPFPAPDRLVAVSGHVDDGRFSFQYLAYPDFLDCRRGVRSLDLAGWVFNSATLSEPGEAEYEQVFEITHNVFSVLGVRVQGREFRPEEDRPEGTPVAILGRSLWQRRFGGDSRAIGSTLVLDGKRYTIVGIAPAGLALDGEADVYTPLGQDPAKYLQGRRAHPVRGLARLHAGATVEQAQAEIASIGRGLAEHYPETNKGRLLRVRPLRPDVDDVRGTLWLLLGAVTLVMLIACANVASLMLARAVSRERELAMRAALGAGRFRLIRQCLTESAVLGVAGGGLGIVLAAVGLRRFLAFWPGDLPRASEVQLDWRVLTFALAVSLVCGLLFGIAPALRVPVRALEQTLRAGARTVAGSSRRLHGVFVISQVALAAVLLVSAGMLGRTLLRLSALDPGVDVDNALATRVALPPSILAHTDRIRAAWDDVLDRARHVPGVQSATIVDTVPLREGHNENGYWMNAAVPPASQQPIAISTCVTPDYLRVMGIRLRAGRFFTDRDRKGSPLVVVIDDVMAKSAFPGEDAVGRQLWIPDMGRDPVQVVGVVGHVRYWGLAGDDQSKLRAQFYYPFAQIPD